MKTYVITLMVILALDAFCKFLWLMATTAELPRSRHGMALDVVAGIALLMWGIYLLGGPNV